MERRGPPTSTRCWRSARSSHLTADRYAALGGYREPYATRDLRTLQGLVDGLHGELGHLAAFNDFAYVLDSLLMGVPYAPPDTSGYSR